MIKPLLTASMRIIILTFSACYLLVLISFECLAQTRPIKAWDKTIGSHNHESLASGHPTTDGGYIIGGWSYSGANGDKSQASRGFKDYWVVKIDSIGNKQWDKSFGGSGQDSLMAIQQTLDGGYILGGTSNSGVSADKTQASKGGYDYWIIKLDAGGNKIWDKVYGGNNYDFFGALCQTSDGSFILGGTSLSGISGDKTQASKGDKDFWIIKIDINGVKLWDKTIGGPSIDELRTVQQTKDKGFILGGISFSNPGGDKSQPSFGFCDYWIVKLDSVGNKIWDRSFGGQQTDYLGGLQQTTDGGFILGGSKGFVLQRPVNNGDYDFWIIKTDSLGIEQWNKTFGGDQIDMIHSIRQTKDGGFIFGGHSLSDQSADKSQALIGFYDFWVLKTDALGNKLWDITLGGTLADGLRDIHQTVDGGFFLAGHSSSSMSNDKSENSKGTGDYWVVKLMPVPTIQTAFGGGNFCAGSTITVPFTITGTFNAGNVFTAQLSGADGNFNSPINIGTLNGTTAGSIIATLPSGLPYGTKYSIRVVASNKATIGSASVNYLSIESAPFPTVKNVERCGSGTLNLEAAGVTTGGQYQWYTSSTGATAINGATSAIFTTQNLNFTTTYYVAIVTSFGCESPRVAVEAKINDIPSAPQVNVAERCGVGPVTLMASGAPANGSYSWYSVANGGVPLSKTNSGTYTTPTLNTSTTFFVAAVSPTGCESVGRTPVVATIKPMPIKPIITFKNGMLVSSISKDIQWYRNDSLLTGATMDQYKPTINGNYAVKAKLGDCEVSSDKYLLVIPEPVCEIDFKIFPNPSTGNFKVNINGCKAISTVKVYNSIGQLIYMPVKIEAPDEMGNLLFDFSHLSKGMYILELVVEGKKSYHKVILQ